MGQSRILSRFSRPYEGLASARTLALSSILTVPILIWDKNSPKFQSLTYLLVWFHRANLSQSSQSGSSVRFVWKACSKASFPHLPFVSPLCYVAARCLQLWPRFHHPSCMKEPRTLLMSVTLHQASCACFSLGRDTQSNNLSICSVYFSVKYLMVNFNSDLKKEKELY